jgi:hypothetical protein
MPTCAPLRRAFLRGLCPLLVCAVLCAAWSSAPPAAHATAAHPCECVEYVKTVFGLHGAAGNAKDMGPFLAAHGFRRSTTPVPGAVVIIQPGYYTRGAGAIYGHVAVITAVSHTRAGSWLLTVRGAQQTGTPFTAAGCNDVSVKAVGPFTPTSRLVTYWLPSRR